MAEEQQQIIEEKPEILVNVENEETSISNKEAEIQLEEIPNEEKPEKQRKFKKWVKGCFDKKQVASMLLTVFLTFLIGWVLPKIIEHYKCGNRAYITFEADFTQVFRLSKEVPNLEYIAGEDLWKENWKKVGTENIVFGGNRGKLLLRGQNIYGTNGSIISFATDAQVICTGDIRTLIDYKHYKFVDTSKARFSSLFFNCTQLVVAPELPITTMAIGCYSSMFSGCISLKTAPVLPSRYLSISCYMGMFSNCISLQKPPELPALELAAGCYERMFMGCTSLEFPPQLPSKKMHFSCYYKMFQGCTSLKKVHTLPAMDLAHSCYLGMFKDCSSLKEAPIKLPATKLAYSCYSEMFFGCISLKKAPEIPATELSNKCCSKMFQGCTSLEIVFPIPAKVLADYCYSGMYSGCISLKKPPYLIAKGLATGCYSLMFKDCTSLEKAPTLPATELASNCYFRMFSGCSSLSTIKMMAIDNPIYFLHQWLENTSQTGTFYKNKNAKWDNKGIVPEGWEVVLVDP